MKISFYNDSNKEGIASALRKIEEITTKDPFKITNVPQNSISYEKTSDYPEVVTYNESFSNISDDINKTQCTATQALGCSNNVFSNYPQDLLCFGALCFVTFAIVGVLGNFVSILALSKSKRLRNATTAFIVNLCVADVLFCGFSMPLSAITFIEKDWIYGEVLCKAFPLVRYSNGAVSLFSVIAITVNRYILIVHPKIYQSVYTKRNIAVMIFSIWLVSLLLLLLPLLEVWGKLGYDCKVGTCTILKVNNKSPKLFLNITAFILPSIVFVVCYLRIFFVVRKASKKTQRKESLLPFDRISFTNRRKTLISRIYRRSEMRASYVVQQRDRTEMKVLRVMLVVFVLFIVCYFPVSFVKIFHKEYDLPILNVVGYLGVYFSTIINPLIYIVMSEEYRTAYKELFCRWQRKEMI